MNFTPAQQAAFDSYLNGENIFITGPGGCGKSYFIQNLYSHAKENGKKIQVFLNSVIRGNDALGPTSHFLSYKVSDVSLNRTGYKCRG